MFARITRRTCHIGLGRRDFMSRSVLWIAHLRGALVASTLAIAFSAGLSSPATSARWVEQGERVWKPFSPIRIRNAQRTLQHLSTAAFDTASERSWLVQFCWSPTRSARHRRRVFSALLIHGSFPFVLFAMSKFIIDEVVVDGEFPSRSTH